MRTHRHNQPPNNPQAKLQKAQQQREYAKAFHADVLKKLAAEEVAQQVCKRRPANPLPPANRYPHHALCRAVLFVLKRS